MKCLGPERPCSSVPKFGTECWNFQDCFEQSGVGFLGLFSDSPELDFRHCFGQFGTEFANVFRKSGT